MGIEPMRSAWKAEVLPLNYTRVKVHLRLISIKVYLCITSGGSLNFRCITPRAL